MDPRMFASLVPSADLAAGNPCGLLAQGPLHMTRPSLGDRPLRRPG